MGRSPGAFREQPGDPTCSEQKPLSRSSLVRGRHPAATLTGSPVSSKRPQDGMLPSPWHAGNAVCRWARRPKASQGPFGLSSVSTIGVWWQEMAFLQPIGTGSVEEQHWVRVGVRHRKEATEAAPHAFIGRFVIRGLESWGRQKLGTSPAGASSGAGGSSPQAFPPCCPLQRPLQSTDRRALWALWREGPGPVGRRP